MAVVEEKSIIQEARTINDLKNCYSVVFELRPHLTEEQFVAQVVRQQAMGYHLISLSSGEKVMTLLGYRLTEHLALGKVLYVDDFVTHPKFRGLGFGSHLMAWIMEKARKENCAQIHLDTGPQQPEINAFYKKHGFEASQYHMVRTLEYEIPLTDH